MSKTWESMDARELLSAAIAEFHPRIALSTAFGVEGVVLLDMLMRIEPSARVFTIDTGRLPAETYALMDAIRARYGCTIDVYFPSAQTIVSTAGALGKYTTIVQPERARMAYMSA